MEIQLLQYEELLAQMHFLIEKLERETGEPAVEQRATLADFQARAAAERIRHQPGSCGEVGQGGAPMPAAAGGSVVPDDILVQELDRLDERLSTFESRLADATPEARALVQAAVEASLEARAGLAPNTTTTNGAPR